MTDRAALIKRTNIFLNFDTTQDEVLDHIRNGGSLIDFCRVGQLNYNTVSRWMRSNKDRSELYDKALSDRSEYIIESVLSELRKTATTNITKLYNDLGLLLPMNQWPESISSTIKEITHDKDTGSIIKISFWSKEKAIELLGKNLGLFVDRIEHSHKVTLESIIGGSFDDSPKDVTPIEGGINEHKID